MIIKLNAIINWEIYNSDSKKNIFWFFNYTNSQSQRNNDTSELSDNYFEYITKKPVEDSITYPLDE